MFNNSSFSFKDVVPNSGYYQNLCINRATAQGNCLVARVVHTTNGRVLEIYSNQYGVKFNTGNEFSLGVLSPPSPEQRSLVDGTESIFVMLDQMFRIMDSLDVFDEKNFKRVHRMLVQIHQHKEDQNLALNFGESLSFANPDFCIFSFLHALQQSAYAVQNMIPKNIKDVKTWSELKLIIQDMHDKYVELDTVDDDEELLELIDEHVPAEDDLTLQKSGDLQRSSVVVEGNELARRSTIREQSNVSITKERSKSIARYIQKILSAQKEMAEAAAQKDDPFGSSIDKFAIDSANEIPNFYKDGRMHGKFNAIYARHCAMAFQTQNYPDAVHHSNFPSSILRPGETYKHSIVYKFSTKFGNLTQLRNNKRCR